jgi:hypothetical protein
MPRFFTKRNNEKYVNVATGEVYNKAPKKGWRIKKNNKGRNYYINLSTTAKTSTYKRPVNNVVPAPVSSLYTPNRMANFNRLSPKVGTPVVTPVKTLTSANLAGKLEAAQRDTEVAERARAESERERARAESEREAAQRSKAEAERELAELKRQLASSAAAERELAELKRQMASSLALSPALQPASVSNNPAVAKFKKMLSMGIPRTAVEQKMRMEGLDVSMLNGAAPASADSGASAAPFRPAGNPMAGLLSGILGGPKLKKTNGPQKAEVVEEEQDPKKKAAMGIAEAAARRRAEMASRGNTRSIEEKLANLKKAKGPEPMNPLKAAITGFNKSALANTTAKRLTSINPQSTRAPSIAEQVAKRATMREEELAKRSASINPRSKTPDPSSPKPSSSNSSPVPGTVVGNLQYSNTDIDGNALPAGIRRVSDAQDTWYEVTGTQLSNWTLANLQAKRPKSRKGGRRANRKGSRKNRRSNFSA